MANQIKDIHSQSYKLYIITREDLSPAYQAVQATHAAVDFIFQYKDKANVWHSISNSIIILSVPTEQHLYAIADTLRGLSISFNNFTEPDIGNELTALALVPSREATQFCKQFRLALRPECISVNKISEGIKKERNLKDKYKYKK